MNTNISSFKEAKIFTNELCGSKGKFQELSIANKSATIKLYNWLRKNNRKIASIYSLSQFISTVESLKLYIVEHSKYELVAQLKSYNIELTKHHEEELVGYDVIQNINKSDVIEIKNVDDVVFDNGEYLYMDEDCNIFELNPKGIVVRQSDPTMNFVSNTVYYINEVEEELKKTTGATRPACGWYAYKTGSSYYYSSSITVERWFRLPKTRKEYAVID